VPVCLVVIVALPVLKCFPPSGRGGNVTKAALKILDTPPRTTPPPIPSSPLFLATAAASESLRRSEAINESGGSLFQHVLPKDHSTSSILPALRARAVFHEVVRMPENYVR